MREILFRGKRTDNGEWVEGYFVKFILSPFQKWWEISTGKSTEYGATERYKVDPDTVGQYTGLKDIDGVFACEHDITEDIQGRRWVIFRCAGGLGLAASLEYANWGEIDDLKVMKLTAKVFLWFAGIAAAIVIFLPGRETITKMLIAQNVTYERVEEVGDTVKEVYEDIMGLFEEKEE